MGKQRFISQLALFATFLALGVIALGAFTRLMDAGLGCPDWPGCYGHFVVPTTDNAKQLASVQYPGSQIVASKAWAEMIHRYFVGGLSLFILSIVTLILTQKTLRVRSNIFLVTAIVGLLIYQIMLGQWTVTLKLLPVIVSQHLLGGYLILSTLWLIHLNNKKSFSLSNHIISPYLLPGAVVALVLLLLQISLGAWTSTNYASLSCPDFPFCMNDNPVTPMHFKEAFNLLAPIGINYEGGVLSEAIRQTIQMAHRLGALLLTLYLFGFMAYSVIQLKNKPELMKIMYIVLGLLCIQICIGMANIIFKLPLVTAISHTLVAAMLLLSIVTFIFKLATYNRGAIA